MDTRALTSAVDAAFGRLVSRLPARQSEAALPLELQEAILEHELSKDIQDVLAAQTQFSGPVLINSLSGASGFHSQFVAPMLLREARLRNSATAAVEWLEKVLSTQSAAGIAVATFWGVVPETPIAVLDNVQLVPFNSLPPSRQKKALEETHWESLPRLATPVFAWQAPTAALVMPVGIEPYLRRSDTESGRQGVRDHHGLFEDIRLCLATSGPTIIIPGPGWFQYTDPDLEAAVLGSATHLRHLEITPIALENSGEFDRGRALTLLHAFIALDTVVKNRVRTAMQRLGQALIRRSPPDRALELAIALETLLVDSGGEHTFKIGLRAALLTASDLERRRRSRAIVEAMYKIRSSLMHSGQSRDTCSVRGYGNIASTDVLSEALNITAATVQRIVTIGRIPDWAAIELSSAS